MLRQRGAITKSILIICLLFLRYDSAYTQVQTNSSGQHILKNILVLGNKKTRDEIILREIPAKRGDIISDSLLNTVISKAKKNIYNTKLFLSVEVVPNFLSDSTIIIVVNVKERWYTLPLPYLELADRSFNVWWHTYHADLRRLSYGIFFLQQNLTGQNDELDIKATAGFNKQVDIEYNTPYVDRKMTERFRIKGGVLFSNEIPYKSSEGNKLLYYQSTKPVRKDWYFSIGYLSRKYIKKREWLTFTLKSLNAFDSIRFYNPDYLPDNKTQVVFPEVEYKFKYDDVDNSMYPLRGKTYEAVVSKRGLGLQGGVNRLLLEGHAAFYTGLGKGWFSVLQLGGQIKLPFDQPYINTLALGYGQNYLRGYEYYVTDGVAFFLAKADLKKRLVHFRLPTFLKSKNYSSIPFTLYGKIFSDAGSVYSRRESLLGNKFLWTGGIGLDIVTLYDISVSINFSFNNLDENGFFFHASR